MTNWTQTSKEKPIKGRTVWVMDSGGNTQKLLYDGMWWFPDKSMYVYFTPVFWKDL